MKKLLLLFAAVAMIGMYSCTKDSDGGTEAASENGIAGMGDRRSEDVAISEGFVLPEGVVIQSIKGIAPTKSASDLKSVADFTLPTTPYPHLACAALGGEWISVVVELANTTSQDKDILFQKGLIFDLLDDAEVDVYQYQRGILVFDAYVRTVAGGTSFVTFNLFCLNEGYKGSEIGLEFEITGSVADDKVVTMITQLNDGIKEYHDLGTFTNEEFQLFSGFIQQLIWWTTSQDGLTKEEMLHHLGHWGS